MSSIFGKIYSFFDSLIDSFISFFSDLIKLKPIDYNEGKTDSDKYYNKILPNIYSNLDEYGKFVDKYFPTILESLTSKKNPLIDDYNNYLNSEDEETKKEWTELFQERDKEIKEYKDKLEKGIIRWERISDIFKNNKKKIKLKKDLKNKIAQNSLGDCYLISFLRGFLRNQPKKYYKLFGQWHPEIGYYEKKFF